MNVAIFRSFPDPYRLSMALYATEIVRRVGELLGPGEHIRTEELPRPRIDGGWLRYWDQYVRYERHARQRAADVNHIIDHGFAHLTRSLPAGRTIVTFHDAVVTKVSGANWTTRRSFLYSVRALPRAAAVVCDSDAARRDLLDLIDLPEDRLHVIPLGVDAAFRPAGDRDDVRRRLGISGDVVLMVGHTQPYMNVERMIRAFSTLTQHVAGARLVKIGLPFTAEQSRLIDQLGIGNRVDVKGRVPSADLPAYYQAADVLLYAPLFAGFGLPPLEAMACGTPVVASNRGAIPEVVDGAAIMVDADDTAALADAMAGVLTDPATRRRMIDAGFTRAARFDWTHAARRLLDLYRSIAHA